MDQLWEKDKNRPQEMRTHETAISLVNAPAGEVDAGSDMQLAVEVKCSSGCGLEGLPIRIVDQEGATVKEIMLASHQESASTESSVVASPSEALPSNEAASISALPNVVVNRTEKFSVMAPLRPQPYTWTAVFPAQEKDDILHQESTAPFSFVVKPHSTSMTVWDVPSPVVQSGKFTFKTGVICRAGCSLAGQQVYVFDETGARIASGTLSDAPWSQAGPLYWAEIPVQAPDAIGLRDWSVKFTKPEDEMAHQASEACFSFMTSKKPDHTVTIQVTDKDRKFPVANADVVLLLIGGAPYRTRTDANGIAKLNVPKGKYTLGVVLMDYKDYEATVDVDSDATFPVEFLYHPDLGA